MRFRKLLVANRGDHGRTAAVAAKPKCLVREAHTGDLDAVS